MSIDTAAFRRLLDFTDDLGVLTLTASFTPERASTTQPVARIEIRNQLKKLQQRLESNGDGDKLRLLDKRLGELGSELDGLLDPRASGRGRALFVGLSDGRREHVHLQIPFEERAILRDRPFLRPLIAAIDEGRPAGLVVADRSGARLLEWSLGDVRELATMDFQLTDAQLADYKNGPVSANPARGQQTASHREYFEDRVDNNRHRFLKQVTETADGLATERGWDRVVIAGSDGIREELGDLIGTRNGREIISHDTAWEDLSPTQIAERAWPLLRSVHRQRSRALVIEACERAAAGGAGAVGTKRVCEAANQGRIGHLLFNHDAMVEGFVSDEGSVHAAVEGHVAQAGIDLQREPHLVERLVERVLTMGGRVTRVDDDDAAARLADSDGLGALLRW